MSRNLKLKSVPETLEANSPAPSAFVPLEEAQDIDGSPAIALREQLRVALTDPIRAPFAKARTINDGQWSPRAKLLFILGSSSAMWTLIIAAGWALFH